MAANSCSSAVWTRMVSAMFLAVCLVAILSVSPTSSAWVLPPTSEKLGSGCGFCGANISVTLQVVNTLVSDHFKESLTITRPRQVLLNFLTDAVEQNPAFKFEATYDAKYGFYISAMNGLAAEGSAYWLIADGKNSSLSVGVSYYLPEEGETIVFSYTTDSH